MQPPHVVPAETPAPMPPPQPRRRASTALVYTLVAWALVAVLSGLIASVAVAQSAPDEILGQGAFVTFIVAAIALVPALITCAAILLLTAARRASDQFVQNRLHSAR